MIGQTLGHYHIFGKIGEGGMGVVYRAHDEQLDRDVAIKILRPGSLGDESARKRFRKEAFALARLSHPNIETVYEFDTQGGVDFLVLECLAGITLVDRIRRSPLTEKEIVHLGIQIAEALQEAHERKIIHRDLKPRNILVTPKGQVKVLDFGLAKFLQPESEVSTADALSSTALAAGTLPYMSPEQLRTEPADERSDIYAMGIVLYEMATGKHPFAGRVGLALSEDILHKQPPQPSRLRPDISMRLEEAILKCMEKEPGNRYQSAKELIVDLRRLVDPTATLSTADLNIRRKRGQYKIAFKVLALLALIVSALSIGSVRQRLLPRANSPHIQSLVVLPLDNFSQDPEQDYFADGVTEALITDLSGISELRVISRTSAMQYKRTKKLVPQIAKELNVDGVIEGSVQRSGERVRVTAQLIDAVTDSQLWAESYDRDLRDVLALQDDLARSIAHEIRTKVTPQEGARLASARAVNPKALDLYLKGRYYWNQRTPDGLEKGLKYFQQAIAEDPGYSSAYAGLADSYLLLANLGVLEFNVAVPDAKAAAKKALELDDKLAEAHASLGMASLYDRLDWREAEKELKVAIELNPSYASAYEWYGFTLAIIGRPAELVRNATRAVELDPLSHIINSYLGRAYYLSRRYDSAIEQYEKTLDLDKDFPVTHLFLGMAYTQKGRHDEAITEIRKAVDLSGRAPAMIAALGYAYAAAGRRDEALHLLQYLREPAERKFVSSADIAVIYAGLGERDNAFKWLEKAYEENSLWAISLKLDPALDGLRADSRFSNLLHRAGLPAD
jgi:serine/threonine protein kinase/Flp pilus assembly protein TadD